MNGLTQEKNLINVTFVVGLLQRKVIAKTMKIHVAVNVPINVVSVDNRSLKNRVVECMREFVKVEMTNQSNWRKIWNQQLPATIK